MRHFDYLKSEIEEELFYKLPENIDKNTELNLLRYSVGALLYIPAINKDKLYKFFSGNIKGATSVVMCLEDSVGDTGEEEAIENIREVMGYIRRMEIMKHKSPLIFIRPKNAAQMEKFTDILRENLDILTGIVIPKANSEIVEEFLEILDREGCSSLYIMPIIETTEFTAIDTKEEALCKLKNVVRKNISRVLNVRIGVTDILGAYSLRRNKKYTIYDNIVFRSFLADLMSFLGSSNSNDIVISGGVSEFYNMKKEDILESYIKELELDKMNGFVGKTVIHPYQLYVCEAMNVVSFEDYFDASNIIENVNSKYGVSAGLHKDRMNEVNPHLNWAKRIIKLSKVYGVFNEGVDYNELLEF